MKLRPGRLAAALTMSLALVLAGCAGGESPAESETTEGTTSDAGSTGGTLTIANAQMEPSFDPTQANGGVYLPYYQAVYDSLVRRGPDGTIEPMLATDWEYDADRTVLTLNLRDDVTFTDGTALDAAAVKANLDAFRNGNGPTTSSLASVEDVEAPDATTIVITLSAPDPSLLDRLGATSGFVASPAAIEAGGLATAPVGSGPYELDAARTVPSSQYTFVKNEDYWDPELQKYDEIVLKNIADPTATLNALLSGQVDAARLTAKTAQQARGAGFTEVLYPSQWNGLLIRDREGTLVPELAIPEVRQAIAYAIDRETIVEQVYQGLGEVTNQIFDPSTTAYVPELDNRFPYDPDKARELMAEAGVDGFSMKMPQFDEWIDPAEAAAIAQNLADIGITVNWEPIPPGQIKTVLADTVYPVIWWSLSSASPWLTATKLVAPYANYNTFGVEDPVVNDLLGPLQTGTDEEQAAAGQELNEYITEQVWFVPIQRPSQVYFTAPEVTVVPQAQETDPAIYNYSPAK